MKDTVRARLGEFVLGWKKTGEAYRAKWLTEASGLYFGHELERCDGAMAQAARLDVANSIVEALNHTPHIDGLELVRSLRSSMVVQLMNLSHSTSPSFDLMKLERLKATAEIVHRFCPT